MARGGLYRWQFKTGSSNGGPTAQPGGERWAWKSRLFGGAEDDGAARMSLVELAEADQQDLLDDYIEAQIHGPLHLAEDVGHWC